MINQKLSPITVGPDITIPEIAEAFAFSYLAKYCTQDILPRVNLAYTRAWGCDAIYRFPRTTESRVGMMVGVFTDGELQKLVIGVEGLNNPSGIGLLLNTLESVEPFTDRGSVAALYPPIANLLWAMLIASPVVANMLTDNRSIVTFGGHSLGAAVAELMAARLKLLRPTKNVRLVKFASPRVGSGRWINLRPFVPNVNVLTECDPIHFFPTFARNATALGLIVPGNQLRTYTQEPEVWRLTVHRGILRQYLPAGVLAPVRAAVVDTGSTTQDGYKWSDHFADRYRVILMNYAHLSQDQLTWRFNYLEHNDENTWQDLFIPGADVGGFGAVVTTTSTQAGPPSASALQDSTSAGGTVDGGDWGGGQPERATPEPARAFVSAPPIETALLPSRRFRRR